MFKPCHIFLIAGVAASLAAPLFAEPLTVSTTGTFGSTVVAGDLVQPDATFTLSFDADSKPAVQNIGLDGFDVAFSGFSYTLNGAAAGEAPEAIRFLSTANAGLFTVFFGPESGLDSNGAAIPEFTFSGAQLYTGTTSTPSVTAGTYAESEWLYTDVANYDDHAGIRSAVQVSSAVPEPGSFAILALGLGALSLRHRIRTPRNNC